MKILKIFGLVVGIHVFALVLIFANPGCSSTSKPPSPADTVAAPAAPTAAVADPVAAPAAPALPPATPPPTFNPEAPAVAPAGGTSPGVRFVPTRPGTPVATTLVPEPVADVTPATTYAVKSGDSLWTIAKKHKLSVAQLTAANGLSANAVLKPGQKLLIPSGAVAPTAAASAPAAGASARTGEPAAPRAAAAPAAGGLRHVVKSGETLGGIARNYGVKAGDLAVANNISDPAKIRPGMELVVPGWDATAGKSGKAANGKAAAKSAAPAAPAAPATPPTINFDTPAPAPAQPGTNPLIPVIRIDGQAPAPKAP